MRHGLLSLAAAALLALPAAAQTDSVEFTWRSTPADTAEQTREVARLYVALYNSGNLRTRTVVNAEGQFIEPFAFAQGVLIGAGLPPAINALLCDLNQPICRRELRETRPDRFDDLAGHIGGYEVSQPTWRFRAGAEVVLPDYAFETFTTLRSVPVPAGWSPSDFEADPALDCAQWGVSCTDLVQGFNPPLLKQQTIDSATLPVAGFTTTIEIGFDPDSAYVQSLQTRALKLPPPTTVSAGRAAAWSAAYRDFARGAPLTDLALKALGSNVILVGDVKNFSVADEPHFSEQVSLFKLISHPFAHAEDLGAPFRNPVPILVLDSPFEATHCDLPPIDGQTPADAAGCGEIVAQPNPITDHAPHVIGLIGAPLNHKGIVGLNPFSQVTFQPINSTFSAEADLLDAQIKLQSGALKGARIANLSWGFQSLQDDQEAFAFAVGALQSKTLVVAAAGNQGEDLSQNCIWIPACLTDLPNVITVVGLDRDEEDPSLWSADGEASNSSANFHIAAIAEGVLSTVTHNKLGQMSGTSQAAPQVTAAASLIYSAAEDIYPELTAGGQRLAPKVVKDRLIYTTDLFRGLQTKSIGGRLNIERAIRIAQTQVVLKPADDDADDAAPRVLSGSLIQFPTGNQLICLAPDGEQIGYHWSTIRRLVYDPDRLRYTVFRHEAPAGDPSNRNDFPLQRISDCNMITLSNEARLLTEDGEVAFRLRDVLDYTSAMIE